MKKINRTVILKLSHTVIKIVSKKIHLRLIITFLFQFKLIFGLSAQVLVNGYFKKNGTYVEPYYRTEPNSTLFDNYSTKGNVNPFTGKPGWIDPYSKYTTTYISNYKKEYNVNYDKIYQSLINRDSISYFNSIRKLDDGFEKLFIAIYKLNNGDYYQADKLLTEIIKSSNSSAKLKSEVKYWLEIVKDNIEIDKEYYYISDVSDKFDIDNDYKKLIINLNSIKYPLNYFYKYLVQNSAAWKTHHYKDALSTLDSVIKYSPNTPLKDSLQNNYDYIVSHLKNMQKTLDARNREIEIFDINKLFDYHLIFSRTKSAPAEDLNLQLFDKSKSNLLTGQFAFERYLHDTSQLQKNCPKVDYLDFDKYGISKQGDSVIISQLKFYDEYSYNFYSKQLFGKFITQTLDKSYINYKTEKRANINGIEHLIAPYMICGLTFEKINNSDLKCFDYQYTLYVYTIVNSLNKAYDLWK